MIEIVTLNGEFYYPKYREENSLDPLLEKIFAGQKILKSIDKRKIMELFDIYSQNLVKDPKTKGLEGVAFLANWLRMSNFEKIVEKNLTNIDYLNTFIGERKRLKAQPRGLACHWIAGNVPTLGIFSLFQSIMVGNANIMRIPPGSHSIMVTLLKVFAESTTESGLSGLDILRSVAIIYYARSNNTANIDLSLNADVRIIWGGAEAVKMISGLPKREHCEDIVFGPKYSFAIFDKSAVESANFTKYLHQLVNDIILFDQAACTSPHVAFFEKNSVPLIEIARLLQTEFEKIAKKYPKTSIDPFIATKIINKRAEYALDTTKEVLCSESNDWTILINNVVQLEEPIESRTIFLKEVESIMAVIPLITRKIQTIGCAIDNKEKLIDFADQATFRGVARCVPPGQMNYYDSPWDGMLFMSRLVNWTTLFYGS